MLATVIDKMRNFDLMTPPVTLNIGGKSGVKTFFGVFMTCCYLVAISVFTYVIVVSFFDTTSPQVAQVTSQSQVNPVVRMTDNHQFPVFYVLMNEIINIPPANVSQYFTILYTKIRLYQYVAANGSLALNYYTESMPVVPCSVAMQNSTIAAAYQQYYATSTYFRKYGDSLGMCVMFNPDESYVAGSGSSTGGDALFLQFYPCTLATGCAPANLITSLGILLNMPTPSVDISNYEDPVSYALSANFIYHVDLSASQHYKHVMQVNEIWDQSQIFYSNSLRRNFTSAVAPVLNNYNRNNSQVNCTLADIKNRLCTSYLEFEWYSGPTVAKTYRSYKTFTQTISQIGGVNSGLLLVFLYINLIYNYYAKKHLLVDRVFKFFKSIKPVESHTKDNQVQAVAPSKSGGVEAILKSPLEELDKKGLEEMKEEAYNVIVKNLDVITIVRELNNLKVLTHLLFKDYHQKLMPLISLNIQCKIDRLKEKSNKESRENKESKEKQEDTGGVKGKISTIVKSKEENEVVKSKGGEVKPNSFDKALKMLTRRGMELKDMQQDMLTLEQKVDVFCYEGLDNKTPPPIEEVRLNQAIFSDNYSDSSPVHVKSNFFAATPNSASKFRPAFMKTISAYATKSPPPTQLTPTHVPPNDPSPPSPANKIDFFSPDSKQSPTKPVTDTENW